MRVGINCWRISINDSKLFVFLQLEFSQRLAKHYIWWLCIQRLLERENVSNTSFATQIVTPGLEGGNITLKIVFFSGNIQTVCKNIHISGWR